MLLQCNWVSMALQEIQCAIISQHVQLWEALLASTCMTGWQMLLCGLHLDARCLVPGGTIAIYIPNSTCNQSRPVLAIC